MILLRIFEVVAAYGEKQTLIGVCAGSAAEALYFANAECHPPLGQFVVNN